MWSLVSYPRKRSAGHVVASSECIRGCVDSDLHSNSDSYTCRKLPQFPCLNISLGSNEDETKYFI